MSMTNKAEVSLSVAVWLASDTYDYVPDAISATGLLKPVKQTVLRSRIPSDLRKTLDVQDVHRPRIGTAVHDAVEMVWRNPRLLEKALRRLDSTAHLFKEDTKLDDIVAINPTEKSDKPIVVHLENRAFKEVAGYKVSGKYDFVLNGGLEDHKTTSTYTYKKDSKRDDFILQGSIYRWLSPEIITKNHITINYMFTDWAEGKVAIEENYPPFPQMAVRYPLMSLEETEAWVVNRLKAIAKANDLKQDDIPECTPKELLQDDPVFKYFANPEKVEGRSTKNFTSAAEAFAYKAEKGKGVVIEVLGKAKACSWCEAASICNQYRGLVDAGLVK